MPSNVNFGYVYEVIIANPPKINDLIIPQTLVSPLKTSQGTGGVSPDGVLLKSGDYLDYSTIPENSFSIKGFKGKGLQLKAKIVQSKETGGATTIELINLSDEVINSIKKNSILIVRAAYSTTVGEALSTSVGVGTVDLPDVFVGQVAAVDVNQDDVDVITKILCGDAVTVQRNSRTSLTFGPMTTRKGVLLGLIGVINTHGIPLGRFQEPESGTLEYKRLYSPYFSGYSLQGYTLQELEKSCNAIGLRCFVALGKLYIEPAASTVETVIPLAIQAPTNSAKSAEIITVTPINVKGQVNKTDSDASNTPTNSNGTKDKKSLSLTTYLDARISIDKVMRLQEFDSVFDDDVNGEYKITSVVHQLDYRGGKWETIVTLEGL